MPRTTTTPSRPYKTPCDNPMEKCPECGGLECLCRPRFFAGQLLTDEDLNRLDRYIVAKNKLHNRYLFGWGVVCGLEVVCHPCNMVAVRPGYALSPCGEDIIVCKETPVDICSLINACRPKPDPCSPIDAVKDTCTDTTDKWVLAIRYQETPSRGVTPLQSSSGSACCSRCSCGGSSGCGCGGSSKTSSSGCGCGVGSKGSSSGSCGCKSKPSRPSAPPQCEPTVLCEGYSFEVCKLPPKNARQVDFGALIDAMTCCMKIYQQHLVSPPADHSIPSLKSWCCSLRESLAELFASHPGHSCTVAEVIGAMCGNPNQNTNPNGYITQVMTTATKLLTRFGLDCICSALLPPCPGPVNDDRIFLATITVQRKDCKIIEICNWDERRFVITFPMLRYWLSWLPVAKNIKKAIANLCCRPLPEIGKAFAPGAFDHLNSKLADRMNRAQPPANIDEYSSDLQTIFRNAMFKRNRDVDFETVVMASFGAGDAEGQPLLTEEEMANPGATVLMHQFAKPLLNGLFSQFSVFMDGGTPGESELASLRATVAAQQDAIEELKARLDKL
jgi:hypothetical protein